LITDLSDYSDIRIYQRRCFSKIRKIRNPKEKI